MNLLENLNLKWKCIEEKNDQNCWRTITGILYIISYNLYLISHNVITYKV